MFDSDLFSLYTALAGFAGGSAFLLWMIFASNQIKVKCADA